MLCMRYRRSCCRRLVDTVHVASFDPLLTPLYFVRSRLVRQVMAAVVAMVCSLLIIFVLRAFTKQHRATSGEPRPQGKMSTVVPVAVTCRVGAQSAASPAPAASSMPAARMAAVAGTVGKPQTDTSLGRKPTAVRLITAATPARNAQPAADDTPRVSVARVRIASAGPARTSSWSAGRGPGTARPGLPRARHGASGAGLKAVGSAANLGRRERAAGLADAAARRWM